MCKCGNIHVVHIGLKSTSKGKVYANVYRVKIMKWSYRILRKEVKTRMIIGS